MIPETLSSDALRLIQPKDIALKIEALKLEAFLKNFLPGQTFTGKVLQSLAPGKALVDFQGHAGVVEMARPLTPGQNLTVQLEKASPEPVLRLVPPDPPRGQTPARPEITSIFEKAAPPGRADRVQFSHRPAEEAPVFKDTPITKPSVLKAPELEPLGLAPGKITPAKVVQVPEPAVALVRLAGREVRVQLPAAPAVQPGTVIQVTPRPQGDGFVLTQVPAAETVPVIKTPTPLELLKTLLPFRQPIGPLLQQIERSIAGLSQNPEIKIPVSLEQRLKETFELFLSNPLKNISSSRVESQVFRMGIHYEARVRDFVSGPRTPEARQVLAQDLKGQLQELAQFLESKTATAPRRAEVAIQPLLQHVKVAVQSLDFQQVSLFLARQEHQPLVVQIPQMFDELVQHLKMYFRKEGDPGEAGSKASGPYTLVFFLELSALGALRADVKVQGQRLDLKLAVESEWVLEFIASRFSELQEQLTQAGFQAELSGHLHPDHARDVPDELAPFFVNDLKQLVDIRT